ncbi:DUF421 domain-containing protein [Bacillus songklensis]|uniref:DUF421 domain-containing protein n=1 Tax=Bacillus songklensis TaxID=1069116 RepID=A0ABV8B2J9_9BACI
MSEWMQIAIRSVSLIAGLFVITKLLGKKQLSKLSFFEYIVGITVGDIAGTLSMDIELNIINGMTSILVWTMVPLIIAQISLKSKGFRNFVEGNSTIFIQDGRVLEKNLRKEKYTIDELLEQLRKKDVFRLADVEFATLEANGDLSVLLKTEKQPVTVEQLFTKYTREKEPQTVIMDGEILDEPLQKSGYTRQWLKTTIEQKGYGISDVFLAQIDSKGELFLDLYDDQLPLPEVKDAQLLLISLKKCEAELEWLSLNFKGERSFVFEKQARKVRNILKTLTPFLTQPE